MGSQFKTSKGTLNCIQAEEYRLIASAKCLNIRMTTSSQTDRFIRRSDASRTPEPANLAPYARQAKLGLRPAIRSHASPQTDPTDSEKVKKVASENDAAKKFHFLYHRAATADPSKRRRPIDASHKTAVEQSDTRLSTYSKDRLVDWYCSSFSAALTNATNWDFMEELQQLSDFESTVIGPKKNAERPKTVAVTSKQQTNNEPLLSSLLSLDTPPSLEKDASLKMVGSFHERVATPPPLSLPDPFKPRDLPAVETKTRRRSRRRSTFGKVSIK